MTSMEFQFELTREDSKYYLRASCAKCASVEYTLLGESEIPLDEYEQLQLLTTDYSERLMKEFCQIHEPCINPLKVN